MYQERRRSFCCVCKCETWQQKLYAGFGGIAWECGEDNHALLANYGDEEFWKADKRYWEAIAEHWRKA